MDVELFQKILVQAITQLALFTLIPFLWWFFTERKNGTRPFFDWVGLKKVRLKGLGKFLALGILAYSLVMVLTLSLAGGQLPGWPNLRGLGPGGLAVLLVYALVTTGLSEEVFFRGFLLKRFIDKDEFDVANVSQAMLFGLFSAVLFFGAMTFWRALFLSALYGVLAFGLGWVNEKKGGGSLLFSWFIRSLAGLLVGLGMMSGIL